MKKILASFFSILMIHAAFAQTDGNPPPFKKFPTFPPVTLLLPGAETEFTKDDLPKKSAVLLILFNPECSHCQHETEEIIKHIDELKDVQIVMATPMPYDSMMAFREKYKLADYKNIIVGQDNKFMLPSFFMINNLPFIAFYNRKKELMDTFEGSMPIEKLIAMFKKED